ncbi:MAG: reductive dehalogenase [Chloroflexi bacterium]|nr:reductive dehalogenase [Chloroflexota bacterium]
MKTHSTVSRRDFMKTLGLGTAGVGAIAATVPVFHDLDELMSTSNVTPAKRPWWVKERDFFDPTSEVDWKMLKRFNRNNEAHTRRVNTMYRTPEQYDALLAHRAEINEKRDKDASGEKGYDRKWNALYAGGNTGITAWGWNYLGLTNDSQKAKTPNELGVAPWKGTPEEGSKLLYAALRFFGVSFIGFNELESYWKNNLIVETTTEAASQWTYTATNPTPPTSDDQRYVFENVDKPYMKDVHTNSTGREAGTLVIPNSGVSIVALSVGACMEATKTGWSTYSKSNSSQASHMHNVIRVRLYNFVRASGGWTAWGLCGHQSAETNFAAATSLTGISENSRNGLYTLVPEVGPNHIPFSMMTDMPIAPTKPIDAGLWKFCQSCHKCAKNCPSQSISDDNKPSWEIPSQRNGQPRVFNNPGLKHFWTDMAECNYYFAERGNCYTCYANCTFSEDRASMIHDMVRSTVSTTSLFNGFFYRMSNFFGYGMYDDPDIWWDMSLPVYGFDSTIGASKGYGQR